MNSTFSLLPLVIALPLVGFLIQALLGGRVVRALGPKKGKWVMGALAVLPIALGFVIGLMATMALARLAPEERFHTAPIHLFDWIRFAGLNIPFELRADPLSLTMVLIITGIGSLIHLYATAYMAEEKEYTRFFTYLNLFVAFMLVLVLGNNLVMMFIGWEGVGLCSYLLIGFWYRDLANAKAANKAFIVNRIGDWGLTLGMFLIVVVLVRQWPLLGGAERLLSYDVILPHARRIFGAEPVLTTIAALLLFVGAMGKSAQFPLYLWLPDAMAGPTPVSALIHAATMVTAGVFLLNRMSVLFQLSPVASVVVASIGAFTALFAALIAFGQTDIKKVLAYSTVSQLGFMFIACGAGAYWVGMFHVTTHAFFKALLFLGSGAVIYAMAHDQDMRNYGRLAKYLPITCWTMFAGYLAIAGVPPLAGFFSKEGILGAALGGDHARVGAFDFGFYAGWAGLLTAALTAMYMTRMTWLTFFGKEERWRAVPAHHVHEHGHDEAHGHESHAHDAHEAHEAHEDPHGFFYEHAPHEEHEHHHALDGSHTPKEVPPSMWIPLVALGALSVIGGWWLSQGHRFEYWLVPGGKYEVLGHVHIHPEGTIGKLLMPMSIGAALLGILAGLAVYWRGLPSREGWDLSKWNPFRRSAGEQFGYDAAMVETAVDGGADLSRGLWKGVDVGLIDRLVNGVAWTAGQSGEGLRRLQTGYIRFYALMMLAGGVGLLGYFVYRLANLGGV